MTNEEADVLLAISAERVTVTRRGSFGGAETAHGMPQLRRSQPCVRRC